MRLAYTVESVALRRTLRDIQIASDITLASFPVRLPFRVERSRDDCGRVARSTGKTIDDVPLPNHNADLHVAPSSDTGLHVAPSSNGQVAYHTRAARNNSAVRALYSSLHVGAHDATSAARAFCKLLRAFSFSVNSTIPYLSFRKGSPAKTNGPSDVPQVYTVATYSPLLSFPGECSAVRRVSRFRRAVDTVPRFFGQVARRA